MIVPGYTDRKAYQMLSEQGLCSADDLARGLGLTVSEALKIVHNLARRGYVERLRAGGMVLFRSGRADPKAKPRRARF